jgi:hypothetical protein
VITRAGLAKRADDKEDDRRHRERWYFWATPTEGVNSKIQTNKTKARGFRNREHFKSAIHCGGLDFYPIRHGISG